VEYGTPEMVDLDNAIQIQTRNEDLETQARVENARQYSMRARHDNERLFTATDVMNSLRDRPLAENPMYRVDTANGSASVRLVENDLSTVPVQQVSCAVEDSPTGMQDPRFDLAFNEGFNEGQDEGREDGWQDGFEAGFNYVMKQVQDNG
jgi:hypothetical protein